MLDTIINVLLSSFLLTAAMPGYIYGGFVFFALIPLFFALEKKGPIVSGLICFLYFFVFSFLNFNYLIPTLTKGLPELFGRFSPLTGVFVYALFCIIQAVPFVIFGVFYGLWGQKIRFRVLEPIFVASLYVISDFLRGIGDIGFTGGRLSDALYNFKGLLQILPFTGTLGLVFLITVVNYEFYRILKKNKWNMPYVLSIFAGIILINGAVESQLPKSVGSKPVVLAQTNVPQNVKYNYPSEKILRYLEQNFSDVPDYLIIFPEAVFPGEDIRNSDIEKRLLNIFGDKTIVIGYPTVEEKDVFNSLHIYSKGKRVNRYDKVKLFPFVEMLPYKSVFGKFDFLKGMYYFTGGTEKSINIEKYGNVGMIICFESFFPSVVRKLAPQSEFIVVSTNDGWYNSKIALMQHFVQIIFRAVENNRYFVQVSNTGLSGVSDPFGNFQLLPEKTNWKILYVDPINKITFYNKHGDYIFLVSLLVVITTGLTAKRKNYMFD
ncbi:MAG: apolipoprotein N-acyltransferase [Fervidobacterium sp.]